MSLSIIYVISILAALTALLSIPKSETKAVWFPICAFVLIGIFCLIFGILNFFGAPFSLWTPLLVNIGVILATCLYQYRQRILNGKVLKDALTRWRNGASKKDLAVTVLILIIVLACSYAQFGFPLSISFITSDPSIHLLCSIKLFEGGAIETSFLTHSITACFIAMIDPFVEPIQYYNAFIFEEIIQFLLSGMTFYSILAILMKNCRIVIQAILVALYMLGYPWNDMIYGFSYLGAGVTSIGAIIFICMQLKKNSTENSQILLLCALSLMLLNLIVSYPLFVPPVYIAIFVALILWGRKAGVKASRILLDEVAVFAMPVIIGYLLVFLPLFGTPSQTVTSALTANGAIFQDLYAGFLFIAPLAIYGLVQKIRSRGLNALELLTFIYLAYFVACLALTTFGKVSPYYFYKLYYPLWLVVFVYTAFGIDRLRIQSPCMLASYAGVWLVIFALAFSGLDAALAKRRPFVYTNETGKCVFPIYDFNIHSLDNFTISDSEMDLFKEARALKDEGYTVNPFANDLLSFWALSLLEDRNLLMYWVFNDAQLEEIVDESDYIVLFNAESGMVSQDDTFLPELADMVCSKTEPVYSNDSGEIRKVVK